MPSFGLIHLSTIYTRTPVRLYHCPRYTFFPTAVSVAITAKVKQVILEFTFLCFHKKCPERWLRSTGQPFFALVGDQFFCCSCSRAAFFVHVAEQLCSVRKKVPIVRKAIESWLPAFGNWTRGINNSSQFLQFWPFSVGCWKVKVKWVKHFGCFGLMRLWCLMQLLSAYSVSNCQLQSNALLHRQTGADGIKCNVSNVGWILVKIQM